MTAPETNHEEYLEARGLARSARDDEQLVGRDRLDTLARFGPPIIAILAREELTRLGEISQVA